MRRVEHSVPLANRQRVQIAVIRNHPLLTDLALNRQYRVITQVRQPREFRLFVAKRLLYNTPVVP